MTAEWIATPQEVERVVAAVLPHASDDSHLPMICCVALEVTAEQRLIAVATDRYSLATSWGELAEWQDDAAPVEATSARIYARDLKRLFAFVRPHRKEKATWTLTDARLTVSVGEESLSVRTVQVEFVKWRELLTELARKRATDDHAPLNLGFTPRIVEHFMQTAKVLGDAGPMFWDLGRDSLTAPFIRIGDTFLGALMPVRLPDGLPQLDLSVLGVDVARAVAA